jgi:ATP-dependent DNA helicase RecG
MTETTDGFEISRRDLQLRGPGDFLGVKQSGLPEFKVADLMEDYRVLEIARQDVLYVLPKLYDVEEYKVLKEYLDEQQIDHHKFD